MSLLPDDKFNSIFPFDKPRNNQREVIEKIINAYQQGKRFVVLSAPTGTGKSCIGYAVAKYFGNSYILTSQKVLQDQYYKDFKIPFVLGRANYVCKQNKNLTCEMGACFRSSSRICKETVNGIKAIACPYLVKREECMSSNHSNLNYSYFLSACGSKGLIEQREIIICDECHGLEDELLKSCTVSLDETVMKYIGNINIKFPRYSDTDAYKCKWLCYDLFEQIRSEYLTLKEKLTKLNGLKITKEYKSFLNKHELLEKLVCQIQTIKGMIEKEQEIVIIHENKKLEYKILHCDSLFKNTMLDFGKRFLFMSASILNYKSFLNDLGINEKDVEYIECDSTFPVENRIIHYTPVGSMSYKTKNETLPEMIHKIDKLLKENKNVKGIIHTVNYDIAEKIIDGISFSDQAYRLLLPRGADKQIILNAFYNSEKPYVLISPSLMEGIDLKEDLSRLCIICKMPYGNLADKWIKTRMNENKEWYINKACTHLVQMTGRSIRSETDYAKTYILDSDFGNLAKYGYNMFPNWWKEAVMMN